MFQLPYQEFYFKQALAPYETGKLRTAVLKLTQYKSPLYHNHFNNSYIYGYPLIQYKSIFGQGAILYLGEAIQSIGKLFQFSKKNTSNINFSLEIDRINANLYTLQFLENLRTYDLINWLPLQGENYKLYQSLRNEEEKKDLLQKILLGNIVGFVKGVGWQPQKEIRLDNFKIYKQKGLSFKNQKFFAFNVRFDANLFLPPHIGLGKGAAHNYGTLFSVKQKINRL